MASDLNDDGKRVRRRHHSLRQLAKRALRIGEIVIEAVPCRGQLVVCVSHPEETPVSAEIKEKNHERAL